jgi:hypothetical protein
MNINLFILNNFQILTKKSIIMSINVYEQLVHLIFYNNKLVGYDFPFWNCFYVFNYFFCQTIVKCGNCHNFLPIIFTLKSDLKKKKKRTCNSLFEDKSSRPIPSPHSVFFPEWLCFVSWHTFQPESKWVEGVFGV